MEIENLISIIVGIGSLLIGLGIMLATIDREALQDKVHTNPLLALYRFPAW